MDTIIFGTEEQTLHEAAVGYAEQGLPVFPLWPNSKNPKTPNGFYDATISLDDINGFWAKTPDANIGMRTGTVTGIVVLDVDVKKGKDGYGTLRQLEAEYGPLPKTITQTTPSGGMHYFFRTSEVVPGRVDVAPGLDTRGEGGYVAVAPSSVDGARYIANDTEAELAECPQWVINLAKSARATGSKTATESRNVQLFHGGLKSHREGLSLEEGMRIAMEANETFSEPLSNTEVTKTVNSAYRYDVPQHLREIEELNDQHAVIMVGGKCKVLTEAVCPIFNWPDIEFSTPRDFKDFYSNRYMEIDGKRRPLGEAWFTHPSRRQYNGLVFSPKGTPEGYYNLWRGFAVDPKEGDCSLYLKHIEENIANGNKDIYDYLIAWMAHTVQHPDNLVGTSIVLRGKMGTGKGVFINEFGKLFGRHYLAVSQSSQLVGKFNAHMKDIVVLFADEAVWAGDKAAEGTLKQLVTEPYLVIEGKGENAFKVKNHLHIMFATNNDWAVPAGSEERRFFVLDVGEKHMQDGEYFSAITKQMDNGGREALLHYLMGYDVANVDLRKFPKTDALLETKLRSMSPAQKFWYYKLEMGCLNTYGWRDCEIATETLYQQYIDFVSTLNIKHRATTNELGLELAKMLPKDLFKKQRVTQGSSRIYVYQFPTLKECREYFEQYMNQSIAWPEED